jgi:6-phosphogluconate dehydrogenase
MEIGLIGLGKMGLGIGRRLLEGDIRVVGFDVDDGARDEASAAGVQVQESARGVTERLAPPRAVWIMLPAGWAVDSTIAELEKSLETGDLLIDGGNSNYRDSIRRGEALKGKGIGYVDVGTSGGVFGRENGYSLMVGGDEESVEMIRPVLETLAPAVDRGWGRVGGSGAGHFAKMVHNGIEYGMMQAFAEGFAILEAKKDLDLDAAGIAEVWRHGSVVRSWLLDLVAERLSSDEDLLEIAPWVADSGEGRWAVQEAIDLDVPAPVIMTSLLQRIRSRSEGNYADRLLAGLRQQFGGHELKRTERGD